MQAHRCTLQGELLWGCGGFRLIKRDRLSVDFEIRATRDDTGRKPNSKLNSHCLRTLGGKEKKEEKKKRRRKKSKGGEKKKVNRFGTSGEGRSLRKSLARHHCLDGYLWIQGPLVESYDCLLGNKGKRHQVLKHVSARSTWYLERYRYLRMPHDLVAEAMSIACNYEEETFLVSRDNTDVTTNTDKLLEIQLRSGEPTGQEKAQRKPTVASKYASKYGKNLSFSITLWRSQDNQKNRTIGVLDMLVRQLEYLPIELKYKVERNRHASRDEPVP
ncbi:hypothetical protein PAAG_01164 [Paracoccidioides lutzii Pb01]|uniref:Uncharacterized protein n=1 Tax=Paracoccidioides lutzii (strain ATCC MYA-826 / Pb01) TaxID=502779 RepID=C1GRL9_PARBA|nr:hypothetical protein PAAG_01164 [Paracoccidioides lutzii Pb01]EEH38243.2 hypothetical protein PAAG_01164 [Paracoccidioides lutzii Pb01]